MSDFVLNMESETGVVRGDKEGGLIVMVWVELTPFDNITLEHKERNAKIIAYRKFAEKLAVKLGLLKEEWFPVYITTPVKVNIPEELLEFLKKPDEVLKVAKSIEYDTDICEFEDSIGRKRRNYWVYAPRYSGRIGDYLFAEILSQKKQS